jgi:hypothetical protein
VSEQKRGATCSVAVGTTPIIHHVWESTPVKHGRGDDGPKDFGAGRCRVMAASEKAQFAREYPTANGKVIDILDSGSSGQKLQCYTKNRANTRMML